MAQIVLELLLLFCFLLCTTFFFHIMTNHLILCWSPYCCQNSLTLRGMASTKVPDTTCLSNLNLEAKSTPWWQDIRSSSSAKHHTAFFHCSWVEFCSCAHCWCFWQSVGVSKGPLRGLTPLCDYCSQLMTRCSDLVGFLSWASPKRFSHGTVSSMMMMFFVASDTRSISGLRVVVPMCDCHHLPHGLVSALVNHPIWTCNT